MSFKTLAEAVAQAPCMIEYRREGKLVVPFDVRLGNGDVFDFEYSRAHNTVYYNKTGNYGKPRAEVGRLWCGRHKDAPCACPDTPLWVAPGIPIVDSATGDPVTDLAARGYELLGGDVSPYGDPFENAIECEDTAYCPRCQSWLPDEEQLCEHVWWCATEQGFVMWRAGKNDDFGEPCREEDCYLCDRYWDRRRSAARRGWLTRRYRR